MKDCNYKPSGELQGNTKGMPDRGTSSGMGDNAQTEGMSLDPDAINRVGGIGSATGSDPAEQSKSASQQA